MTYNNRPAILECICKQIRSCVTVSVRTMVLCLLALPAGFPPSSYAAEQRCNLLGANCVCSEPFNTTDLVRIGSSWYNPGDSTTKECSTGIPGGAIERNADDIFGSNDATALDRLPAGHQLQFFARAADGHLGTYFAGHTFGDQFIKRIAVRYYIYHTPDFQFAQEGICTNSKMAQFDNGLLLDKSFGFVHMYNFTTWTPSQDCCLSGPGPDQGAVSSDAWRGKWWRVEIVFVNRAGGDPGWVGKVYMKNITDNRAELTVIDTSASGTLLNPSNTRTPPTQMDQMWMNNYRETGCNGWLGFSHYMAAGWDTDQGQRIGPAFEIEGPPPGPPTNFRVQ